RRVQKETTRSQKYAYESPSHRHGGHRPHGGSMRPSYRPAGHRPHGPSMNPRRPNMNGARPYKSFFNQAPSYETRPFLKSSALRIQYRAPWVPTVNRNNPPVSRKFPTGSTKCSTADMGMKGKAVKPSACWFWKPSQNLSNKGLNNNSVSVMFKKYTYIDTQGKIKSDSGCSRHMTCHISYLSDFEPFDGGYVYFGQGGCKITRKRTIKTSKLEFENVYFVKDLKYNLFSVLQICDNKNSVMFTDSECIVLGRDFKLLDDVNILLGTPRQHNMYSIDLNNIVPH
nr:ribonuclease H-like domain-containing protein [Tanacetum cinerariifolium]